MVGSVVLKYKYIQAEGGRSCSSYKSTYTLLLTYPRYMDTYYDGIMNIYMAYAHMATPYVHRYGAHHMAGPNTRVNKNKGNIALIALFYFALVITINMNHNTNNTKNNIIVIFKLSSCFIDV